MDPTNIRFGTDGWRGIIAEDFTFDNVALVAKAISQYLTGEGLFDKPLLIGYDHRFSAENYAAHLANCLEAFGTRAVLTSEPVPTPVLAFGVQHTQAAGAIMLTASHNPYYYQGLKFIPHFAGPAMPETTDRITELIQMHAPDFEPPRLNMEWAGGVIELKKVYFDHLDTIVNHASLSSAAWKVLYNPMHGLGGGFLDDYLRRANVEVVTVNAERDVYFGGKLPDPSPANLAAMKEQMVEEDCQVMIGTDGDADRFGILDARGAYFGANQALPLLADFLVKYKQKKGPLVRTVATSHLIDGVAAIHGLELIETPVGFKYVGDELRKGALIGGEESGGISMAGHMPEKDGILASLLMLELASTTGEDFRGLLDNLMQVTRHYAYQRVDEHMEDERKRVLFDNLLNLKDKPIIGKKVISRNDIDGIKFILEDGSWLMARASGTEPVVRIYMETAKPDQLPKFKAQVLEFINSLATPK